MHGVLYWPSLPEPLPRSHRFLAPTAILGFIRPTSFYVDTASEIYERNIRWGSNDLVVHCGFTKIALYLFFPLVLSDVIFILFVLVSFVLVCFEFIASFRFIWFRYYFFFLFFFLTFVSSRKFGWYALTMRLCRCPHDTARPSSIYQSSSHPHSDPAVRERHLSVFDCKLFRKRELLIITQLSSAFFFFPCFSVLFFYVSNFCSWYTSLYHLKRFCRG